MKKIIFLTICIYTSFLLVSYAQEEGVDLNKIVVTPTRVGENIKGTTSSVNVLTSNDIEANKDETVKELITNSLSLDMTQAGSSSGQVSVFTRGTNSGQTQVMIDNVRVYDPIATNAAFNLAYLTLDNVDRVEIVRGPQSVLYGSDAVGGVINIITRKGEGKPSYRLLTEAGTHRSSRESLESEGRIKDLSYSFGFSRSYTRGISQFRDTSERDAYRDTGLSLRLDYDLNENNTVGLSSRLTNASYDYDNSVGLKDDPDLRGREEQSIVSSYLENKITDNWKQRIQFSFMRNYRRDLNDKDSFYPQDYLRDWYLGENQQLNWQHTLKLSSFDTALCGFDWQREMGNYYYYTEYSGGSSETHFPKSHSNTKGLYLENLLNLNDIFHLNTGARIDDHSYAGTKETYKIDGSYLFKSGTKVKGGWGSAFKAPTLYQLHALPDPWFLGGNPNLKPEESQTYEAGFEQEAFNDRLNFGVVYFHTQLKDLIDAKYNLSTWTTDQYSNVNKARIFGYETTLNIKPFKELSADIGYTWQDTEDKSNGDELLRRPKNKVFLNLKFAPVENFDLSLKSRYVGRSSDSGNRLLKGYSRTDICANYRWNKNLETFLRIENIFDATYEEIKNYAEPGRSFYGGMKLSF